MPTEIKEIQNQSYLVKALDLFLVPTSMIRLVRNYDNAGEFEGSKIRKVICYGSAIGTEACRLGLYYEALIEPFMKL